MQYEGITGSEKDTVMSLQCIASFSNTEVERLFYLGFLHSLYQIVLKEPKYKILIFEEIGHLTILMRHWRRKNTPIFTNKSAYYLFNMIYPCSPISPEKCLFII
jgi:hypothetical protein